MKIFAGNPVNSLEFDEITYTISTESWSFTDWDSVCTILENDKLYLYFKNKKYEINEDNFLFNINGSKIIYGGFYESINSNFYLYSSLARTDLIVLHLKILHDENINKMLETIKSHAYFYKIPILIVMRNGLKYNLYFYSMEENKVDYENKHYFIINLNKNNKFTILSKNKKLLAQKLLKNKKEADKNVNKEI